MHQHTTSMPVFTSQYACMSLVPLQTCMKMFGVFVGFCCYLWAEAFAAGSLELVIFFRSNVTIYYNCATSLLHSNTPGCLSVAPAPQNVTENAAIQFYCATQHSMVSLSWSGVSGETTVEKGGLPGGGKWTSVRFIATAERNNSLVTCTAGGRSLFEKCTALLLVQGETEVEEKQFIFSSPFNCRSPVSCGGPEQY